MRLSSLVPNVLCTYNIRVLVLCPDHTLSQEKGCGDFLGCAEEANAMPCKLANEIGLHQKYVIIDCSTIDTANLGEPRMGSRVTRPFSS